MIRSVIAAIYIALLVTFGGPPMMLYTFLTRSGDALYHGGLGGTLLIARAVGIRVRAEGRENIPPGTCVFAANHTSNVDPPMIMGAIQRRVALLAKESLFRIPILGPAFRMGEFVPVDRADREEALASLDLAAGYMKNGRSFLIYPGGDAQRGRAPAAVQARRVCAGDQGWSAGGAGGLRRSAAHHAQEIAAHYAGRSGGAVLPAD